MRIEPFPKNQIIVGGTVETFGAAGVTFLFNSGYKVVFASGIKELQAQITGTPGVVAIIIDGDVLTIDKSIGTYLSKISAPILIYTSKFRIDAVAFALQQGFDEFLAKPLGKKELLAVLQNAEEHNNSFYR